MIRLNRLINTFISLTLLFFSTLIIANEMVMIEPAQIVINNPQDKQPIQVKQATITGTITGSIAKTQIELVLFNPNNLQLEGELQFPLLPNQTVSGFALDINGEMRPAVAVEKALGQQVFEDVTRQKIDPALLEKTNGNFYKLRVYPLPAQGTRTVRLEISQTLSTDQKNTATYQLPLMFAQNIGQLNINLTIQTISANKLNATLGAEKLTATQAKGKSLIQFKQQNYQSKKNNLLQVNLPVITDTPIVTTEHFQGQTYFYAEIPATETETVLRKAPEKLTILWDASGSGEKRDHNKEFALLDAYFQAIKNVDVTLVVVRNKLDNTQTFSIKQGNWQTLKNTLSNMVYDGATNPEAMRIPKQTDLALLFSDGLFNFGSNQFPDNKTPLFAISASAGTNADLLRQLAQKNGGSFIDLLFTQTEPALKLLQSTQPVLNHLTSSTATELLILNPVAENGYYRIAGILAEPKASIKLAIQKPDGQTTEQIIHISNTEETKNTLAAERWAQGKILPLLAQQELFQAQIIRLGKQFGLVTPTTSLIVLDNIQDYVQYEIEPPASLQKEYQHLLAQKQQQKKIDEQSHLQNVYQQFTEKEKWWNTEFSKKGPPAPKKQKRVASGSAPDGIVVEEQRSDISRSRVTEAPQSMAEAAPVEAAAMDQEAGVSAKFTRTDRRLNTASKSSSASIQLKKWTPDEPYIKRLQAAKSTDLYTIYLDEKPAYQNSTAFFLDVSDLMFDRGQHELALRVLSNLAEMNLENRHILRILGYRLVQAKEYKLAIPIFERVKQLSPNEPQSFRDLALAYEKAGDKQQAIDNLWTVVSTPWHGRFPGIELIALTELNAIVAQSPRLNTSKLDKRLLHNLPVDVRTILSWDADNTDIDLHVIDPDGEEAYYGHRLTYQGGRMSADFTGGYGPEEFSLKKAKPGKYTVKAKFYGHNQQIVAPATTLMLTLTTNFGKTNQKEEQIILRLSGRGDMVTVGTFTVK